MKTKSKRQPKKKFQVQEVLGKEFTSRYWGSKTKQFVGLFTNDSVLFAVFQDAQGVRSVEDFSGIQRGTFKLKA